MYPVHTVHPLTRMLAGLARPTPTSSRLRAITRPHLLPHTIQLCIHCRHNPAGFWVSHPSGQTVRRPWCLSCCQDLDPGRYGLEPFDGQTHAAVTITHTS